MLNIYLLSCVNEDLNLVDTQLFSTDGKAHAELRKQYDRELQALRDAGETIVEESFETFDAELAWGDRPYCYHWQITQIINY